MQVTSPLRMHAASPAIVLHVPAGTDLLWRQAFEAATAFLAEAVTVPVSEPYEVLITMDSTINHYQAAKAAIGALPILVQGGTHGTWDRCLY